MLLSLMRFYLPLKSTDYSGIRKNVNKFCGKNAPRRNRTPCAFFVLSPKRLYFKKKIALGPSLSRLTDKTAHRLFSPQAPRLKNIFKFQGVSVPALSGTPYAL